MLLKCRSRLNALLVRMDFLCGSTACPPMSPLKHIEFMLIIWCIKLKIIYLKTLKAWIVKQFSIQNIIFCSSFFFFSSASCKLSSFVHSLALHTWHPCWEIVVPRGTSGNLVHLPELCADSPLLLLLWWWAHFLLWLYIDINEVCVNKIHNLLWYLVVLYVVPYN